jgi:Rrf2 family protein
MFSQTFEYALRVVAHLATVPRAATTREIHLATKVPESYLAKVLGGLSRGGLITSQRGPHGGSVLARGADAITLFDVAEAIDPLPRIKTCPLGLRAHGMKLCSVHARLDQAMSHVEQVFRTSTIAELLAEPNTSVPLCEGIGGANVTGLKIRGGAKA